jgi:GDP-L-fucose synthase
MPDANETGQASWLNGRRFLITGGAGFLGRHVCRELRTYAPQAIFVPRRRTHDLRKRSAIVRALEESNPEVVLHLAASVGGIGANRTNPGRYFYDNAIMGLQLMEESRRRGILKFVNVGTVCSYPKYTTVPFRETDLWNGYPEETNAPYGLAKKMLLVQAQAYRQQYGLNAITLLPANLYGPYDNFSRHTSHVIPAVIRKVLEAVDEGWNTVEVWGTGQASRDFLFVRDAARAIVRAADMVNDATPINIGSGQEVTIEYLVRLIAELCGFAGEIYWNSSMPDGQPRRCLDISQARRKLGLVAKTNLRDGLIETIAWYRRRRQRCEQNGAEARGRFTPAASSGTT